MTSEDYRKITKLVTNEDLYHFAEKLCEKHGIDPAKDYCQTSDSPVMSSAARRQLYIHKARTLLRCGFFLGATELETLRIAEYLIVITKSIDNRLDYKHAYEELKIRNLEEKYSESAFYQLNVPFSEIERWVNQNGGYGVSIKHEETEMA